MLNSLILIFASCFLSQGAWALSDTEWQKAIVLYDSSQYEAAAQAFESIAATEPGLGHALYNLGNAYYKAGFKGKALAAYYGARVYLPRDPDLSANIKYVQKFTEDRLADTVDAPLWTRLFFWVPHLSAREGGYLATSLAVLSLLLAGFGFFILKQRFPRSVLYTAVLFGFMAIYCGFGEWLVRNLDQPLGAVTAPEVSIYSDRNENAALVFKLHEGAPVRILDHREGWVKLRISDGKMGWAAAPEIAYFL